MSFEVIRTSCGFERNARVKLGSKNAIGKTFYATQHICILTSLFFISSIKLKTPSSTTFISTRWGLSP